MEAKNNGINILGSNPAVTLSLSAQERDSNEGNKQADDRKRSREKEQDESLTFEHSGKVA